MCYYIKVSNYFTFGSLSGDCTRRTLFILIKLWMRCQIINSHLAICILIMFNHCWMINISHKYGKTIWIWFILHSRAPRPNNYHMNQIEPGWTRWTGCYSSKKECFDFLSFSSVDFDIFLWHICSMSGHPTSFKLKD